MSLHVFPVTTNMEFNSKKTEMWDDVIVKKTGSGRRKTLSRRAYPDWGIQVKFTGLGDAQVESIAGFIAQHRGEFQEFLWLDPVDFQETAVRIGTGDGSTTKFQLVRNLADKFVFPVADYVSGSLSVYVDGVAVTVLSVSDGLATLASAPALNSVVTATFQYYWRVALDGSKYSWTDPFYNLYKFETINLVTVGGG